MINLLIDALIALTKLADRGMTAVEKNVRLRATPRPVDDAQPTGAGDYPVSAAGAGGHLDPTSALLAAAAVRLQWHGDSWDYGSLIPALRDRSAQLAAHGD